MARWVVHEEALDDIDTEPIMAKYADEIADDARRIAANGSGRTRLSIRVASVSRTRAVIVASPRNPRSSPQHAAYAYHLEKGTSDTRAQPFMRPAGLRYRT